MTPGTRRTATRRVLQYAPSKGYYPAHHFAGMAGHARHPRCFIMVIIPEQKREFELSLESKARGVAVSIRGVAAGAAVSEDYSAVVDQATQVLSGDNAIDYVVITKNDGFSIVVDRPPGDRETR